MHWNAFAWPLCGSSRVCGGRPDDQAITKHEWSDRDRGCRLCCLYHLLFKNRQVTLASTSHRHFPYPIILRHSGFGFPSSFRHCSFVIHPARATFSLTLKDLVRFLIPAFHQTASAVKLYDCPIIREIESTGVVQEKVGFRPIGGHQMPRHTSSSLTKQNVRQPPMKASGQSRSVVSRHGSVSQPPLNHNIP